jgi:peptidoglycan hydrolase-like protein with peptidoglycan-binding domain
MDIKNVFAIGNSNSAQTTELKIGSSGDEVEDLQIRLAERGLMVSSIDKYFGKLTEFAVLGFQTQEGLKATGVADSQTLQTLKEKTSGLKEGELSPYFTEREFTRSPIAKRHNINNDFEDNSIEKYYAERLAREFLTPIRNEIGREITVNSAYRSERLNDLVGGVPDSDHREGRAVDFYAEGFTSSQLAQKILRMVEEGRIPKYRQMIVENSDTPGAGWIHLSMARDGVAPKNQILVATPNSQGVMVYREISPDELKNSTSVFT